MALVHTNFDRYQRIASVYDLLDLPFEYGRYRHIRPRLFEGLSGRILDAGVGTGRNMPFYPAGATVIGVDLSPAMLARAGQRARRLGRMVELHQMDITSLTFANQSFDAAVSSFLFCVLPGEIQVSARDRTGSEARWDASPPGVCASARHAAGRDRAPVGTLDGMGLRSRLRSTH